MPLQGSQKHSSSLYLPHIEGFILPHLQARVPATPWSFWTLLEQLSQKGVSFNIKTENSSGAMGYRGGGSRLAHASGGCALHVVWMPPMWSSPGRWRHLILRQSEEEINYSWGDDLVSHACAGHLLRSRSVRSNRSWLMVVCVPPLCSSTRDTVVTLVCPLRYHNINSLPRTLVTPFLQTRSGMWCYSELIVTYVMRCDPLKYPMNNSILLAWFLINKLQSVRLHICYLLWKKREI